LSAEENNPVYPFMLQDAPNSSPQIASDSVHTCLWPPLPPVSQWCIFLCVFVNSVLGSPFYLIFVMAITSHPIAFGVD